jgi:molybdopterin-guanine dinucleotide biosynthesis protein A
MLACGVVRGVVEAMLVRGSYKASRLLTDEGLRVAWIEDAELRAIDPELRSLRNINAPTDL